MTGDHATGRQTARKAVLFCRACGHDAPLDADWDVTTEGQQSRTAITCPDCGHVVVTQPEFDDAEPTTTVWRPIVKLLNSVVDTSARSSRLRGRLS